MPGRLTGLNRDERVLPGVGSTHPLARGARGWADIYHNRCRGPLVNHPRISAVEHLLQITMPSTFDSEGLLFFDDTVVRGPLNSP